MANPIAALLAAVKQRPALALAAGGVGIAAAVSVGRRRQDPEAVPGPAVASGSVIPSYGTGLSAASPLDSVLGDPYAGERASATATITTAINAGNAALLAELQRQRPGSVQPVPGSNQPTRRPPTAPPAPVRQPTPAPKPPSAVTPTPRPSRISRATAVSIIRQYRLDPAKVIGYGSSSAGSMWINTRAADYVWSSRASFEAWLRRAHRL